MSKENLHYAVVRGVMLSARNIQDILPHGGPALTDFLNGVVEFSGEPGNERLIAVKTPSADERPCIGHFPGMPVWPAWARFEMACLSGAMLFYCLYGRETGLPMFGGMEGRTRTPAGAFPGDLIFAEIATPRRRGPIFSFSAKLYVEDTERRRIVFSAEKMIGVLVK